MKYKVGQKVRINKVSNDFHLDAVNGEVVTITSLPGGSHPWLYRVEFDKWNQAWEENEWEYVSEEDLESFSPHPKKEEVGG